MAAIRIYHVENSIKHTLDIPNEIIQRYPNSPLFYFWKNHSDEEIDFTALSQNLNCEFTFESLKQISDVICDKVRYIDVGTNIQQLLKFFNLVHPLIDSIFTPIHVDATKKFDWLNTFLYHPGQFLNLNHTDYLNYHDMLITNKNIVPVQIFWKHNYSIRTSYQQFIGAEIIRLRNEQPGLPNRQYMVMAAVSWNKFRNANVDQLKTATDNNHIVCINVYNGLPIYYKFNDIMHSLHDETVNEPTTFMVNKFRAQMCMRITKHKDSSKRAYNDLFSRDTTSYFCGYFNILQYDVVDHKVLEQKITSDKILRKNIVELANPKSLFESVVKLVFNSEFNVMWDDDDTCLSYGFVHV